MQVTINYCYYHPSRDVGGDHYTANQVPCIPTHIEGQLDANFNVLIGSTARTIDPYQSGQVVSLDQLISTHAVSGAKDGFGRDILITIEEPGVLDGLDAYIQSSKDSHYV